MRALTSQRSARAGGVILVVRFATGAVLNYAFGVALTWLIAPADFGAVAALQNVLLLCTGVLTAGFPWHLATRLAAVADPREAAADVRTALAGNAVVGAVLAAAFTAAQLGGVRLIPTDSVAVTLTVAAEIVVLAVNAVLNGALQGTRRFGGLGAMQSTEIVVKCLLALGLVAAVGSGTEGVALGFLGGSVVATVIATRALAGVVPGPGPLRDLRALTTAGPFWVATAGFTFLLTADVLGLDVVGAASGVTAAAIAVYQACSILARAGYFVADALVDAVFPFMAAHRDSPADAHRWMVAGARWVPLVVVPVLLVMVAAPGPLLGLFFPSAYGHDTAVLRLLAVGTLGLIVTNHLVKALFALGRAGVAAAVMPLLVAAETLSLVLLVPRLGLLGAAAATCVAGWLGAGCYTVAYWRVVRPGRVPFRAAGRWLVALGPTALVLTVAGSTSGAPAWALLVLAGLVYVGLAHRLRLVDQEYVDRLARPLRSLSTRVRGTRPAAPLASSTGRHRS